MKAIKTFSEYYPMLFCLFVLSLLIPKSESRRECNFNTQFWSNFNISCNFELTGNPKPPLNCPPLPDDDHTIIVKGEYEYFRMTCVSPFPLDFDFDGNKPTDAIQVRFSGSTNVTHEIEINVSKIEQEKMQPHYSRTGNYRVFRRDAPEFWGELYIYFEEYGRELVDSNSMFCSPLSFICNSDINVEAVTSPDGKREILLPCRFVYYKGDYKTPLPVQIKYEGNYTEGWVDGQLELGDNPEVVTGKISRYVPQKGFYFPYNEAWLNYSFTCEIKPAADASTDERSNVRQQISQRISGQSGYGVILQDNGNDFNISLLENETQLTCQRWDTNGPLTLSVFSGIGNPTELRLRQDFILPESLSRARSANIKNKTSSSSLITFSLRDPISSNNDFASVVFCGNETLGTSAILISEFRGNDPETGVVLMSRSLKTNSSLSSLPSTSVQEMSKYILVKQHAKPNGSIEFSCVMNTFLFNSAYRMELQFKSHKENRSQAVELSGADLSNLQSITCFATSWDPKDPRSFSSTLVSKDLYKFPVIENPWPTLVTIAALITALVCFLSLLYYRYFPPNRLSKAEVDAWRSGKLSVQPKTNKDALLQPYDTSKELKKEDFEISVSEVLGKGTQSFVYKGKVNLQGIWTTVAVKTAKRFADKSTLEALLSEIKIMIYLKSCPFIVELVGSYTVDVNRGILYLFMEYCEGTTVLNILLTYKADRQQQQQQQRLTQIDDKNYMKGGWCSSDGRLKFESLLSTLYTWAMEIAYGMQYVSEKKIIHGDLAARNILLDGELHAKIGDFGLSNAPVNTAGSVSAKKLIPWACTAPEGLTTLPERTLTTKSDVWSYGVLLWEIFSLCEDPYTSMGINDKNILAELQKGRRLPKPLHASDELYEIMRSCWMEDPEERPSFKDISCELLRLSIAMQPLDKPYS